LGWSDECGLIPTTILKLSFPSLQPHPNLNEKEKEKRKTTPVLDNSTQSILNISNISALTGFFINGQYLYLTSSHGQLIRIISTPLVFSHNGTMTIVIEQYDKTNYSSDIMPHLSSPALLNDGTVWMVADWWGMFIQVHLTDFCDDSVECEGDNDFPNWKFGLIIGCSIVGTICCLFFACFILKRLQQSEREL